MIRVNILPNVEKNRSRPCSIYNLNSHRSTRCTPFVKPSALPWIYSRGPSPPPCIPEEQEEEWEAGQAQTGIYEGLGATEPALPKSNVVPTVIINPNQTHSDGIYWPDTNSNQRPLFASREPVQFSSTALSADLADSLPQGQQTDSLYADPDDTYPFVIYANCYVERNRASSNANAPPVDSNSAKTSPKTDSRQQTHQSDPSESGRSSAKSASQQADSVNQTDSPLAGVIVDSYSQQNPGFIDTPRGNTGIIHHSTSAFARVPRNLSPESKSPKNPTQQAPQSQISSSNSVDSHATYEEAWDVKMTRQLGFGIPQLPVTHPHAPSNSSPVSLPHGGEMLSRAPATDRTSSTRRSLRHPEHRSPIDLRSTCALKDGSNKAGLLFHENRLFEGHKADKRVKQNQKIEPTESHAEYDYAYNGSWSMGVQLNMKLAINGNNTTTLTSSTMSTPTVAGPPHVSNMCTTGHPVHKHKSRPRHPFDADYVTEDGLGDTRVTSDFPRSRFVDPTPLIPQTTGPLSPHTTAHGVPPYFRPSQPTVPQIISTKMNSRVSPRSVAVFKPGVLSPNLELVPLDDQPWYHPSLSRSEAEELLADAPEGTFLVRNSETCLNDYSLTIKHKIFVHMKISRNATGHYILGDYSQPYPSVPQMIYHYARTLVPVRGAEYVTLKHPFCRPIAKS